VPDFFCYSAIVLAPIIWDFPGGDIAQSMSELAKGSLTSGISRLAGALMKSFR
jgi:uncharacterized membrane protein YjjP (DUF1212 family)